VEVVRRHQASTGCGPINFLGGDATHLCRVWDALRKGDTLAIVQFNHRLEDWVTVLQNRVAQVLGVEAQQVRPFRWATLCLYLVDR
jgi:hypothetical protein